MHSLKVILLFLPCFEIATIIALLMIEMPLIFAMSTKNYVGGIDNWMVWEEEVNILLPPKIVIWEIPFSRSSEIFHLL